jgi:hypothetical protein
MLLHQQGHLTLEVEVENLVAVVVAVAAVAAVAAMVMV